MRRSQAPAVALLAATLIGTLFVVSPAAAADTGIYGADGSGPGASGTSGAYTEPNCTPSHTYDVYIGEIGWADAGGGFTYNAPALSGTDKSSLINEAYNSYSLGHGIGAGAYYFLYGVAESGLAANASNATWWGGQQAANALVMFNSANSQMAGRFTSQFIFADVESAGNWSTNLALNQDVWNGYLAEMVRQGVNTGVYASQVKWASIMGTQSLNVAEWTPEYSEGSWSACPTGVLTGGPAGNGNAVFPNNQSLGASTSLMWQWVSSSAADYDQVDLTHYNAMFGGSYSRNP